MQGTPRYPLETPHDLEHSWANLGKTDRGTDSTLLIISGWTYLCYHVIKVQDGVFLSFLKGVAAKPLWSLYSSMYLDLVGSEGGRCDFTEERASSGVSISSKCHTRGRGGSQVCRRAVSVCEWEEAPLISCPAEPQSSPVCFWGLSGINSWVWGSSMWRVVYLAFTMAQDTILRALHVLI